MWSDLQFIMQETAAQIVAQPWWFQILPGLNIVGLFLGLRRLARLELMVETLWNRSGITQAEADDRYRRKQR